MIGARVREKGKKDMQTIKLAFPDELKEVQAKKIDLFDWVNLYVHRDIDLPSKWKVTELTTGLFIVSGRTQKEAIQKAKDALESVGKEKALETIAAKPKVSEFVAPVLIPCEKVSAHVWQCS